MKHMHMFQITLEYQLIINFYSNILTINSDLHANSVFGLKFRSISPSAELDKTLSASIIQTLTWHTQQGMRLPFRLVGPNGFQRFCMLLPYC